MLSVPDLLVREHEVLTYVTPEIWVIFPRISPALGHDQIYHSLVTEAVSLRDPISIGFHVLR